MNSTVPCLLNHRKPATELVIIDGPCTIFFSAVGLIGNMYGLRQMRFIELGKNFQIYLRALSLWDMSVLVCALLQYGLLNMAFLLTTQAYHLPVWSYLANMLHGPLVTALTGSCWTTVAIAVLRYMGVAQPVSQLEVNSKRSVVVCALISLCAVCYCMPIHFEVTLAHCFDLATGMREVQIWPRLFLVEQYRVFYRSYAYLVFVSVGPFVAILGLSVRTLLLVRRSIARTGSCRSSHRQRNLAILFSVLLLKFVVCNLPATGLFLLTSLLGQKILTKFPQYSLSLCNFTALLHNATNFLLYLPWRTTQKRTTDRKYYSAVRRSSHRFTTAPDLNLNSHISSIQFEQMQPLCGSCPSRLELSSHHENVCDDLGTFSEQVV